MKKKTMSEIWSETPFRLGSYKHRRNGKIAIARKPKESKYDWEIDTGKKQRLPILRGSFPISQVGTGNYFFNKILKDYDFVTDNELTIHPEEKQ